jgi:hypothetical protein
VISGHLKERSTAEPHAWYLTSIDKLIREDAAAKYDTEGSTIAPANMFPTDG